MTINQYLDALYDVARGQTVIDNVFSLNIFYSELIAHQ